MKISALATLLIAATAHAAETKQSIRKAEVEVSRYHVICTMREDLRVRYV